MSGGGACCKTGPAHRSRAPMVDQALLRTTPIRTPQGSGESRSSGQDTAVRPMRIAGVAAWVQLREVIRRRRRALLVDVVVACLAGALVVRPGLRTVREHLWWIRHFSGQHQYGHLREVVSPDLQGKTLLSDPWT